MSELLQIAMRELGVQEVPGVEHNPRILEYAKKSGFAIVDDETPWCSVFVNFCCEELKLPKSGKADARSWLSVGTKTVDPVPGDIVIFWRESLTSWKGHVGFFLGYSADQSKVFCLGGNQGNQVSVLAYSASKVLGFRRIGVVEKFAIPEPVLKQGSRGVEVIKLQRILSHLDFDCGNADGVFDKLTVDALKLFQAKNQIGVDGVYGSGSKEALEGSLQL